jgi:hypothetical protein
MAHHGNDKAGAVVVSATHEAGVQSIDLGYAATSRGPIDTLS